MEGVIRIIEEGMEVAVMGDMEVAVMVVAMVEVVTEATMEAAMEVAVMVVAMGVAATVVMVLLLLMEDMGVILMEVVMGPLMEEEDMEMILEAMVEEAMGGIGSLLTNQYAGLPSSIMCNILLIHSLVFQDYWMQTMMLCMVPLHQ